MMIGRLVSILAAASLASAFSDRNQPAAVADCSAITFENSDDCMRLNQIQLLGTHNSYHIAPAPPMLAVLGPRGHDIEYTHRPLVDQLSLLGIRKFELDVFADPRPARPCGRA